MSEPITEPRREKYIGDGVYASFDGWYVWLKTQRENGEHQIGLEPVVFKALHEYCKQVWETP